MQLYNVLRTTLSIRINGISTRADIIINLRKLTTLEKEMVVQEIFDLDSRGFPLRMRDIEDITNRLLAIYDAIYIGLRWTFNFIKLGFDFFRI